MNNLDKLVNEFKSGYQVAGSLSADRAAFVRNQLNREPRIESAYAAGFRAGFKDYHIGVVKAEPQVNEIRRANGISYE